MYTHKLFIVLLVIVCSILTTHGVKAIQLSKEEKIQFDTEFRQLQKPSIKTIQNEHGDIYDCVDFYKQPAFDHPLLKNHTFHHQMRPSFAQENRVLSYDEVIENIELKDETCPTGSVPIRRYSKNEFYHIRKFTQEYAKYNTQRPTTGTHFAILRTNSDPQLTKYYGGGANFGVYNISVRPSQYSSGEITFRNNDDMIKVGWTVNPLLNKDARPHIFQYFNAGQSHCFNILCPGFVNIKKTLHIDAVLTRFTERGGKQNYMPVDIFQDAKTDAWWLVIGKNLTVGFWPNQIFSSMSTSATYVAVGGEAYGSPYDPLPPMGNGYYPVNNKSLDAWVGGISVINENLKLMNPDHTESYCDNSHYGVFDKGIVKNDGREIFYGGTTLST